MQKAEKSAMESNRAVAVATNVEIRRTKARLMEELPKLRKLAQKKVSENCLGFRIYVHCLSMFQRDLALNDFEFGVGVGVTHYEK